MWTQIRERERRVAFERTMWIILIVVDDVMVEIIFYNHIE